MSAVAPERTTPTDAPEQEPDDPTPRKRKGRSKEDTTAFINRVGIMAAPLLIAGLVFVFYLYYQSLGLDSEDSPSSQRSALAFGEKLLPQLEQHLRIAAYSTVLVVVVAVPIGILLTRPALRRAAPYIITVANSGQAIPAYGLLVIGLIIFGQGLDTTVYMLALFALLPVLRNTMVGLDGVDRNVIEAGRGMGMTKLQALTRIELPLAVPVITAGIRTAMIINISMATLAFLIGGGALGITISAGLKLNQDPILIVGAGLVAILALTFDWIGALIERYLRPRGL